MDNLALLLTDMLTIVIVSRRYAVDVIIGVAIVVVNIGVVKIV